MPMTNLSPTKPHENVMLLVMSTLPRNPKINTYQFNNTEYSSAVFFKSISQMEPHTKLVLHMLAEKGETLDRIVILESMEARTEHPANWSGETATSCYTKRIRQYLGQKTEPLLLSVPVDELKPPQEETVISSEKRRTLYHESGLPIIHTIDLEDPLYYWHTANHVRSKDGSPVHLYMDMQGGDRNAVSQLNAVVVLLRRQHVTIKGRFANDFVPTRDNPLHTIREASSEYKTYDLISAMDIFTRYGWGDELEAYFKTARTRVDQTSTEQTKEQQMTKFICEASSAISKCNPDGFDAAIQKIEQLASLFDQSSVIIKSDDINKTSHIMREYIIDSPSHISKANAIEQPSQITELDVIYADIRDSYKDLFGTDYRYVRQIRWCLEKHFLQQALTIFESKMPTEFIRSGLLYYMTEDDSDDKRTLFYHDCEEVYERLRENNHYRMKDINHYLILDYPSSCCTTDDNCNMRSHQEQSLSQKWLRYGLSKKKDKEKTLSLLKRYKDIRKLRHEMNHAAIGSHGENGFFMYMKNKYYNIDRPNAPSTPRDTNWEESSNTDYAKVVKEYLDEWEKLANQVPKELHAKILDLS